MLVIFPKQMFRKKERMLKLLGPIIREINGPTNI